MRLAMMHGDLIPSGALRSLGFEAVQVFFGSGAQGDDKDPEPATVDRILAAGNTALAAMTVHVDLVGPQGSIAADVDRLVRCVEKTAALDGRFGANQKPVLIWHPSSYPKAADVDDRAVFGGLCEALSTACTAAERSDVHIAVEITRAGSVGSAETFMRLKDHVPSPALKVCMDAANFVPDRTPCDRALRLLGPDTVIAHGKDVRFQADGQVEAYGPVGSGTVNYPEYMQLLQQYGKAAYFVLEYYRSRQDLLRARDIVSAAMS